ncbi:MAG: T9SS type A sorting domain-containing protein [Paraprevotella sp.]|nr:T9SS type A sorting domain-containing protein [Paraprevotella sp.]
MKRLLLSLILACPAALMAQNTPEWTLVELESGNRVLMDNVGFLLAADEDDTFSVICKDGLVIYGAKRVTFELTDPTTIHAPAPGNGNETPTLRGTIGETLRLTGCAQNTIVHIYDTGGRKVCTSPATGHETTINVGGLPAGMYVLKADKTAIKFVKK